MGNLKRRKLEVNWSNLCRDFLRMVLERLSFTDFERAKAVCSAWWSVSKESLRKQNRIPWLILFPYERSKGNSCAISNPADKSVVYTSRNLGVEFTQSRCIATCGSWLLMHVPDQHQPKLYILNPFTGHRITLPPLDFRKYHPEEDSPPGTWMFSLRGALLTAELPDLSSLTERAVLWVDPISKDYMVIWSHSCYVLFFSRTGDDSWNMFPYSNTCWQDFVYKHHFLYILSQLNSVEIFDFSRDSLLALPPRTYDYHFPQRLSGCYIRRIAVTPSGEVLLVKCYSICSFYVYKMNHATKAWDDVPSLDDQALILDLGITLPAKHVQGLNTGCIYFSGFLSGTKHVHTFDLATRKVEPFVTSTRKKFSDARWFLPTFSSCNNTLAL